MEKIAYQMTRRDDHSLENFEQVEALEQGQRFLFKDDSHKGSLARS